MRSDARKRISHDRIKPERRRFEGVKCRQRAIYTAKIRDPEGNVVAAIPVATSQAPEFFTVSLEDRVSL